MSDQTVTERLVRHERLIVVLGLSAITLLAWVWVMTGAGTGMSTIAMTTWQFPPPVRPSMVEQWSVSYAVIMFFMWWIMMVAMMTPSAAPMILLYARAFRHSKKLKDGTATAVAPTFAFALGYLVAWAVFSVVATLLQWALEQVGVLHAMLMWSIDPIFTGTVLLAAGIYQLTPLKNVCLTHCRSPIEYLSRNFRSGTAGAFQMGWHHGLYCLGCCWFLMALLFAGGIMNLVWIAGLAIFVLVEKVAPGGYWIARVSGVALMAAGVWMLLQAWPVAGLA